MWQGVHKIKWVQRKVDKEDLGGGEHDQMLYLLKLLLFLGVYSQGVMIHLTCLCALCVWPSFLFLLFSTVVRLHA